MSRLSDLYKAMENLRKEGLPVTEDLEIKTNELEENSTGDRSLSRRNSQKYNLKCYKIIEEAGH